MLILDMTKISTASEVCNSEGSHDSLKFHTNYENYGIMAPSLQNCHYKVHVQEGHGTPGAAGNLELSPSHVITPLIAVKGRLRVATIVAATR